MDRPERNLVRPGADDIDWMTDLLTLAFLTEAPTTHLFVGPRRERQVRYFMRCSVAYAVHFGECHASTDRRGVALWLLPGATAMTPGRMRKAGMFAAPWRMGPRAFFRFMGFAAHTDRLHRAAVPSPHYYLFALGVHPDARGEGIGRRLMRAMFERADRERRPVYLETQEDRNVRLYESLGFDVVSAEPFPKLDGLMNYGMVRRPDASEGSGAAAR